MMDYIRHSEHWNPYDNENMLIKWIATYYSVQKEKGKIRKESWKNLSQHRISSRKSTPASNYFKVKEDQYDKNTPVWPITFEELSEAYKTTAMKRHLIWYSSKTLEGKFCLPLHKIFNKDGKFPRRITWLYVTDGKQ